MLQPLTDLLQSNPKQLVLPPPALDSFHAAKTAIRQCYNAVSL